MACSRCGSSLAGAPRAFRPAPIASRNLAVRRVACASRSQDDGKTWGEIGRDAADVLKSAASKVKNRISKSAGNLSRGDIDRDRRSETARRAKSLSKSPAEDLSSLFGGGLMGRALGGIAGAVLKGVSGAMEEARRETQGIYEEAVLAIQGSDAVREALGAPIEVSQPMSQSSSRSTVNGRTTKQTSLALLVAGARGQGQARVDASEMPGGEREMRIRVSLPGGRVIDVSPGGRGGGGDVIDVDIVD